LFPGLAAAVVIAVVRALRNKDDGDEGRPRVVSRATLPVEKDGLNVTITLWMFLVPACWAFFVYGIPARDPLRVAIGSVFVVLLFPWWVCRRVVIPLGLPRVAYAVAWLSRITWRSDRPGGPAFAAALALLRARRPSRKVIDLLERTLRRRERCLQPSGVAATALLEAAKGNLAEARALFESLGRFDERLLPPTLLRTAAEWLAAEAAAEGDWQRVYEEGVGGGARRSRAVSLLEAIARRVLGAEGTSLLGLWMCWLIAPRRWSTFAFVRRLAAMPAGHPDEAPGRLPRAPATDTLARALHSQLELHLRERGPDSAAVVTLAERWDAALHAPETRAWLRERARVVGGDADMTLAKARRMVTAELADLSQHIKGPVPQPSAVLLEALADRREELHGRLERQVAQMADRAESSKALPGIEEWREVMKVLEIHGELTAMGEADERHLALSVIERRLSSFAVWLYNDRGERPIANAIFSFLWHQAAAVGDEAAAARNEKNSRCAL
jgi:hypothetical protein